MCIWPCVLECEKHVPNDEVTFLGSHLDGDEEVLCEGDHLMDSEDASDPEAEMQSLKLHVSLLQAELKEARKSASRSLLRLDNIKDKNELVRFYTGFPDYEMLLAVYEQVLESDAKVMKQWDSRRCGDSEPCDEKHGPSCKLPLLEQFFLTIVRLCLGSFETDLAFRFGLSQSSIS